MDISIAVIILSSNSGIVINTSYTDSHQVAEDELLDQLVSESLRILHDRPREIELSGRIERLENEQYR
jgi:hypothetical protein